jgi:Flp pilus assembly protein TadG
MKSKIKRQKSKIKNKTVPAGRFLFLIFDFCLLPFDFVFSSRRRGTFSLQLLVVLVPVFFGLMGFAVDLGRLYLIKAELNQAATAMALAAAGQLIGTAAATDNATNTANQLVDDSTGHAARYNFGGNIIGQTTGLLTSQINSPAFFATMADATGAGGNSASQADGTTARHAQVTLTADAPLLFWSFLSLGQSRSTPIGAVAVAGISAPLCVACDIEPFAIAAIDSSDTTDFGFGPAGAYYTFAYQCSVQLPANPAPASLLGTVVSYVLIDHYDVTNSAQDESQQLYAAGANGLLPAATGDTGPAGGPISCLRIGDAEFVWGSQTGGSSGSPAQLCGNGVPNVAHMMLCGVFARLDQSQSPPSDCNNFVTDVSTLATAFSFDSDVSDPGGDYTAYTGNGRRVITVPVVDNLTALNVLGFRQFLVVPDPGGTTTTPSDQWGRFAALYMGMSPADSNTTPAPVKQGTISGCQNGAQAGPGPGKVVLHQ